MTWRPDQLWVEETIDYLVMKLQPDFYYLEYTQPLLHVHTIPAFYSN